MRLLDWFCVDRIAANESTESAKEMGFRGVMSSLSPSRAANAASFACTACNQRWHVAEIVQSRR